MSVHRLSGPSTSEGAVLCERCSDPVESPYVVASAEAPVCVGCMTERELGQLGKDLDGAMAFDRLLHKEPPRIEGWEFAVHRRAARYLSGDILDIHDHGESFSLAVGDVMGKGLPAAMLRVVLQSGFRAVGSKGSGAVGLLETARSLLDSSESAMGLVSLFSADVVPSSGELRYVNAGHPPPILVRAASCVSPLILPATAPILGFAANGVSMNGVVRRLTMAPGDILVAYSDGVTEAESRTGEPYETGRLMRALTTLGSSNESLVSICRAVVEDIERFSAGDADDDDRTLLMVRRDGVHAN